MSGRNPLTIHLLGEMSVRRNGHEASLPPSRKTRALLAYLVLTGRAHRRERLCSLLWDVTDDPRGALRWSLSKLRALVDEPDCRRILTDRETVAFDRKDVRVDVLQIHQALQRGTGPLSTDELLELAALFHGELLEGLELTNYHDFEAWCVAEREQARGMQATILRALVERLSDEPARAVPYARTLVEVDPLDEAARAGLVLLLGAAGRRREAEQQVEAGQRLARELGTATSGELAAAWDQVRRQPASTGAASSIDVAPEAESAPTRTELAAGEPSQDSLGDDLKLDSTQPTPFVGRRDELARLGAALEEAGRRRELRMVLVTGEPGVGKTRILTELVAAARRQNATTLVGRAFEAESSSPYGPWVEALRGLLPASIGPAIGTGLAPLIPELSREPAPETSRDRLFGAVVDLVAARAHSQPPVLLVLDDVQWCDDASSALLHYVARMNAHRPLLIALAAREGELLDNDPILRVLRGLRREHRIEEIHLGPLDSAATAELVHHLAADLDAGRVFDESGGNPLFALELARARPQREDDVPPTLAELVRDRIDRLPAPAGEVLRWAAVLGCNSPLLRVKHLTNLDPDDLMSAFELLERHALLQVAGKDSRSGGTYVFAHDVVWRVVYGDLSEPRRRLMHWRACQVLAAGPEIDERIAAELAHHAGLAADAATAARACVVAGRRCLRVFANTEAYGFARRGLRHAQKLQDPERVERELELVQIRVSARRPRDIEVAAREIEALSERALDHGRLEHARLGFHVLSHLRWERGDWSGAQRHTLRAELVSRAADDRQRVVAMAEAARCLTLLERDLGQAEALVLEAGALSRRAGVDLMAIADAKGMLRLHQDQLDEAADLFGQARLLARRDGDRIAEFQALEHLVMVEMERERFEQAREHCLDLVRIADKLRAGSEAPFAHALVALVGYAQGDRGAGTRLDAALADLRIVDAKYRLAYALTRAASVDLANHRLALARTRAEEALEASRALQRPSEMTLARVILAEVAIALGDATLRETHLAALRETTLPAVALTVRRRVEHLVSATNIAAIESSRSSSGDRPGA